MGLRKSRECCVHVFTETCLHHNIPDRAVTLDRWNRVRSRRNVGLRQDEGTRTLCLHEAWRGLQTSFRCATQCWTRTNAFPWLNPCCIWVKRKLFPVPSPQPAALTQIIYQRCGLGLEKQGEGWTTVLSWIQTSDFVVRDQCLHPWDMWGLALHLVTSLNRHHFHSSNTSFCQFNYTFDLQETKETQAFNYQLAFRQISHK